MASIRPSAHYFMLAACGLVLAGGTGASCVKVSMPHGAGSGGATAGATGGTSAGATGGASTGATGGGNGSGGGSPAGTGGLIGPTGSGGASATTTGGSAGPTGSGGSVGNGGRGAVTADAGVDRICQQAELTWEPKIPTVFVMVDRSGSMFDCNSTTTVVEPSCATATDTAWTKLKTAVLAVVGSLQAQVRFGFASFTGTNPMSGGMCPLIDKVAPSLNNAMAIAKVYDGLPFQPNTTQVGMKFETPARQSLDLIGAELLADTSPGEKYILFVTDGQPDYCDDSNSLCAPDSVIGGLQALKAKGITTIVIGLQSAVNDLPAGVLQAFANAGAGEPTVAPLKANLDTFAFYDQCNGIAGWHADLVTSAKAQARGVTVGTYATAPGPTKPYTPDVSNQTMLMNQLSQALAGVKSCVFDLGDVNGKSIKVDVTQLDQATISLMGAPVPHDDVNGWRMNSPTQLELMGTACATWRLPATKTINFGFPCQIVIIE